MDYNEIKQAGIGVMCNSSNTFPEYSLFEFLKFPKAHSLKLQQIGAQGTIGVGETCKINSAWVTQVFVTLWGFNLNIYSK